MPILDRRMCDAGRMATAYTEMMAMWPRDGLGAVWDANGSINRLARKKQCIWQAGIENDMCFDKSWRPTTFGKLKLFWVGILNFRVDRKMTFPRNSFSGGRLSPGKGTPGECSLVISTKIENSNPKQFQLSEGRGTSQFVKTHVVFNSSLPYALSFSFPMY